MSQISVDKMLLVPVNPIEGFANKTGYAQLAERLAVARQRPAVPEPTLDSVVRPLRAHLAEQRAGDDIKYLELKVHAVLEDTGEVLLTQTTPQGNLSARPRRPAMLDACADTIVAVLRLTGTLI